MDLAGAAGGSLTAAGLAAAVTAVTALPVALLAARHRGPLATAIERPSYTGYALPGIVVALALVFLGTRVVFGLYQTLATLVFAFVVLFPPLAVGAARTALGQVSPRVEEAARALGRHERELGRARRGGHARTGAADQHPLLGARLRPLGPGVEGDGAAEHQEGDDDRAQQAAADSKPGDVLAKTSHGGLNGCTKPPFASAGAAEA